MRKLLNSVFYWGSRNRIVFSAILALAFFLVAKPNRLSLYWGSPFILLGEGIRIWASGYIIKNERVTSEGPYSLCRNPLYVGNFFLGFGFVIIADILWMVFLYFAVFYWLYSHTIRNEEEYLMKRHPEEWGKYVDSVPRFFPFPKLPKYVPGNFQWALIVKHREYNNWISIVFVIALLWGKGMIIG